MKSKSLLIFAGSAAVLAVIAMRMESNARRARDKERRSHEKPDAYVHITERSVDGFPNWSPEWMPLGSNQADSEPSIEWQPSASADATKSPFTIRLRSQSPFLPDNVKQVLVLIIDGKRSELQCAHTEMKWESETWRLAVAAGRRPNLEAICTATSAAIELNGKKYDIDERGLVNCRELLKRSERAAN